MPWTRALPPRLLLAALALAGVLLPGGSSPAWAGDAGDTPAVRLVSGLSLTPDGDTLVFSWRGDLWRVSAGGGDASRITFHPASDTQPRISPDGRTVAFVSNRDMVPSPSSSLPRGPILQPRTRLRALEGRMQTDAKRPGSGLPTARLRYRSG